MRFSGLTNYTQKAPIPLAFGELKVSDVTSEFLFSPEVTQWAASKGYHRHPQHFPEFSESQPQAAHADVSLSGNPWWYPFDKYFMAADLNCDVILKDDKQQSHKLEDAGYYLSTQVPPNFVIKRATKEDFREFGGPFIRSSDHAVTNAFQSYDPNVWRHGVVVLALHRPLFQRFFAVFFGIVAVVWICVIGLTTETKQLPLNVVGYFLSIWAIRGILAVGAPKITTLMDYVTLELYAILLVVAACRFLWGYQQRG